ncbi:MAG: BspA family leucine-rich repeat surface protein [Bacteroidales bacterium]|nr:BspA family leucine-rich repeat surface protein [Bacteroidales bacterium]
MITKANRGSYFTATNENIKQIITNEINRCGYNINLNDIDVSAVTDMSELFMNSAFNGDISEWNVSNVTNMESMFANSKFNGDISKWNVSNVTNVERLFAYSKFDGDLTHWRLKNAKHKNFYLSGTAIEKDKTRHPKFY